MTERESVADVPAADRGSRYCPTCGWSGPLNGPDECPRCFGGTAADPLAGLTPTGRRIVEDFIRQSRDLAAAHERLDIYAVPPGPIVERLEWWFQQDSETLDALVRATPSAPVEHWEDYLPDDIDAMLAELEHTLSEACTQTKNQNVIAAHTWVGQMREARRSAVSNPSERGRA